MQQLQLQLSSNTCFTTVYPEILFCSFLASALPSMTGLFGTGTIIEPVPNSPVTDGRAEAFRH